MRGVSRSTTIKLLTPGLGFHGAYIRPPVSSLICFLEEQYEKPPFIKKYSPLFIPLISPKGGAACNQRAECYLRCIYIESYFELLVKARGKRVYYVSSIARRSHFKLGYIIIVIREKRD